MKWIDISHTINNETPVYPGDEKTSLTQCRTIENDHYNAYLLQSGLHAGTHVDVPLHMLPDSRMVADFPVEAFTGKGVLLNVCGEACITMKPAYKTLVFAGAVVLLHTGFDKFYFEERYFHAHPVVSEELAQFLLARNIKMLGMDMPSPDAMPFTFHKALLEHDVMVLENLTNLQALVGVPEFEVFALPLKLAAEGSLVRAVCRIL